MTFVWLRTHSSIGILCLAGYSGGGGPAVSSGLTFPAFVELKQQTSHCNSMPVDPSTDQMVGIVQNIMRNCQNLYIHVCL